jgi:FOG: TPR repeat, SEL1 subfamily
MAQMYYGGEGVPQDYSEALHCYKAAAEGKDRYAYYALGRMFDTGTGVEQNRSAAASWFTLASKEMFPMPITVWRRCVRPDRAWNKIRSYPVFSTAKHWKNF